MLFLGTKELQDIANRKEGTLEEHPFALLLHAIAVKERSVVLEIRRNQLEKKILFEEGVPVECRSNLLHETLGKFLVMRGKLSEENYQRVLAESAATSAPFGDVLLRLEFISVFDFFKLMQQNLAEKLLDGFTWKEGKYRIHTDVPAVDSPLKVKVPQLVLTGITRYAPQATVDAHVGPLIGTPLTLHPSPAVPLAALKLGTRHSRLSQLLKQRLRMDELGVESRLPPDELTRVLCALALLGVVVPADQVPAQAAPPKPATVPVMPAVVAPPAPEPAVAAAVAAPPAPAAPPAVTEKERNDVIRAFLVHRKQDAFELLGVSVNANAAAFREAYLSFAQRYAPWRFQGPEFAGLGEKAEDLFIAGARALATLMDPESRNSLIYRKQNAAAEPKKDPSQYFAIKTELLDSETQYRQGVARMQAGKFADAIPLLEFASDCDPQNGAYRADTAWCRYKAAAMRPHEVLKDLLETLRMDPECGAAMYYAGELYRAVGDRVNAEAMLRKACKALTGDRRPVEALKAVLTEPPR